VPRVASPRVQILKVLSHLKCDRAIENAIGDVIDGTARRVGTLERESEASAIPQFTCTDTAFDVVHLRAGAHTSVR
jgi:hypothetical protein